MSKHKYTAEMRQSAVDMLIQAQPDYPSLWAATRAIADKTGCTAETLRKWHKKHLDSQIPEKVQVQSDKERIKRLEREVKELSQANEILKKAAAFFAQAELDRPKKR